MLDAFAHRFDQLPNRPGVGYKPQHFSAIMDNPGTVEWLEIHAENYMGMGGRPLAQLRHLAERFAFSVHGVGLSIGGEAPLDPDHLNRLKQLVGWLQPARFSEHLAWSTHDGSYFNDLLPLPYTKETLTRVADHIDELQNTIGRQMMLENPSSYLKFAESTWSEPDFLREVATRTGCGLLLDVNNIYVNSINHGYNAEEFLSAMPAERIMYMHIAGHYNEAEDLIVDTHGADVIDPVWNLLQKAYDQFGVLPTLLERDFNIPPMPELLTEVEQIRFYQNQWKMSHAQTVA